MTMELDWRVCSRARLSRDPRFDGKFFIAVLGSGVYCRSVCPAPTAKEKNVRYFATAAAAAAAGFRPCLRCRPECSPGTPAWMGTPTTVARALRLIAEDGLTGGGVENLAGRLGVGARYLRRLFVRHLGATPSAVLHTQRLHFAKKLLDETKLPMCEVAIASGFGSVRRFNAAIRALYKRTPTQIRRLQRRPSLSTESGYLFHLGFRPPYDWTGMLAFLAARATPGVELVSDGTYLRSIVVGKHHGHFEVSLDGERNALKVRVHFENPLSLFSIIERIRSMFDLNADWPAIVKHLRVDPALAPLVDSRPGLRIPGCWDGFELAVRAILGQQVSVKGATTMAGRLARAYGEPLAQTPGLTHLFPTPQSLASADLTGLGLTRARSATIQAFSRAVRSGDISFHGVTDAQAFSTKLQNIPGIGNWTAQYIAMRALGEPDAFPVGDLGLVRALHLRNPRDLERRAELWRPWRAYATMYLWTAESHTPNTRRPRNRPPIVDPPPLPTYDPQPSVAR